MTKSENYPTWLPEELKEVSVSYENKGDSLVFIKAYGTGGKYQKILEIFQQKMENYPHQKHNFPKEDLEKACRTLSSGINVCITQKRAIAYFKDFDQGQFNFYTWRKFGFRKRESTNLTQCIKYNLEKAYEDILKGR